MKEKAPGWASKHVYQDMTEMVIGKRVLGGRRAGEEIVLYAKDAGTGRNLREITLDLDTAWEVCKELMELLKVGYEEPEDSGWTDADYDADTLASAGWGTDEDYGG